MLSGLRFGKIKRMEQELKPKVTLVFGRICSGKSQYRSQDMVEKVYVSNIVRSIIESSDRDKLQNTMHLDDQIADRILQEVELIRSSSEIIVDGIRQVSIVEKVLQKYPDAELVWLEVPIEERKRRYDNRGASKDVESFEVADNKPIELECQRIFQIFKDNITTINNY
jgi:hypothetical protein